MKHTLFQIIALAFTTQLAVAQTEVRGTLGELAQHLAATQRVVSVTGESELKVPADRVVMTLKLTSESKSLEEALRINQELRAKVTKALTGRGIPADRIDSGRFASTPRHWVFSEKVKSYKVEDFVKVTAADQAQFQAAARLLDEMSGLQYHSIDFEHSNKEELKRKALAQALQNATGRKKVYEEQLGIILQPIRFRELPSAEPRRIGIQSGSPPGGVDRVAPSQSYGESIYTSVGQTEFNELVFAVRVTVDYTVTGK